MLQNYEGVAFNEKISTLSFLIAASCAAMAQSSITGKVGFGINKIQPLPTTQAALDAGKQGMQMMDGEITLTAAEDLGGGYKATASSTIAMKGRETAVSAKDATIALLTPVGQVTVGAVNTESSQRRAWADTKISLPSDPAGDNMDLFAFTTMVGPVYATASYAETGSKDISDLADAFGAQNALAGGPGFSTTNGAANNKVNGGPGAGGGPIQVTSLNFSYSGGALSAGLGFSSYGTRVGFMTDPGAAGLIRSIYEGRTDTSLSVAYDMGVAKLGIGLTTHNKGWGTETNAGIAVPVGAASIGLTYEHKVDDSATLGAGTTASQFTAAGSVLGAGLGALTAGDLKGTAERTRWRFGVDYALSKTASFNVSYGVYQLGNAARTGAPASLTQPKNVTTNEYQVRFMKTF